MSDRKDDKDVQPHKDQSDTASVRDRVHPERTSSPMLKDNPWTRLDRQLQDQIKQLIIGTAGVLLLWIAYQITTTVGGKIDEHAREQKIRDDEQTKLIKDWFEIKMEHYDYRLKECKSVKTDVDALIVFHGGEVPKK